MTSHAEKIKALQNSIRQHNIAYYKDNSPTITDEAYDALYSELVALESAHPDLIDPDSPTQKLDIEAVDGFSKVRHQTPMMSIGNTFSFEGIQKFDKDMSVIAGKNVEYSVEKKYDGLAISLYYRNGQLVQAATRGDHEVGEDVTANVRQIKGIPQSIQYKDELDVRGEIMMTTETFIELNKQRELAGEKLLANSRNAAAGALRLLDPMETGRRNLVFKAYSITYVTLPGFIEKQSDLIDWLGKQSFPVDIPVTCIGAEAMQAQYDRISAERYQYTFDIDGVVFKLNNLESQQKAGFTSRRPKAMIAYKFNQQESFTVVEDIIVQIGRTGAITPLAILKPVIVGGVTISRATLHNEDEIRRLDVRVGDIVTVRRNGDVIPGITGVSHDKRPVGGLKAFEMPKNCPCCGSAVVRIEDEAIARCTGGINCSEQRYQQLDYFVSRPAMNIDGIGEQVVRGLFKGGIVSTPDQFYDLTVNDFLKLEGFALKSAQNAVKSINDRRVIPLRKFLVALGIRNAGEGTAKRLALSFGSIRPIMDAKIEDFIKINDVGPVVAASLFDYFSNTDNRAVLEKLLRHIKVEDEVVISANESAITGKTFVITGTLPDMSRDDVKKLIESNGGIVSGSVSKKTNYLLCGEEAGSKLDKANELGVKVLSLDELKSIIA
jgi:DNA ligase (NAD+)